MSDMEKQQTPAQSHFQFQMWDTYLNVLNRIWNLDAAAGSDTAQEISTQSAAPETPPLTWSQSVRNINQQWHVPSTCLLPAPTSLTGKLLQPFKKFILRAVQPSIDEIIRQQNEFNAKVVQTFNTLQAQQEFNSKVVQTFNGFVDLINSELERLRADVSQHLQQFQAQLDAFQAQLDAFQAQLDAFQTQFDTFQTQFDVYQTQFDTFQTQFDTFQTQFDTFQTHLNLIQSHIENRLEQIEPRIDGFELMVWTYDRRKEALEIEQILLNQKLETLFSLIRPEEHQTVRPTVSELPAAERQGDYSYFLFENVHRGTEPVVKEWLTDYVTYFEGCAPVLDVGCGRGEFLEILREHQIEAYGIDMNQLMVKYCQEKGLNVLEADVFAHLESLPDNSLGGIFAAHLVEHLSPNALQKFFQRCYDKLQPHKYVIAETPNPRSLYMLSQVFYQDFSHQRPLDPNALNHLVRTLGFDEVDSVGRNKFPQKNSGEQLLQLLDETQIRDEAVRSQIAMLNNNIRQLNNLVYGYLNYAIIAKKVRQL